MFSIGDAAASAKLPSFGRWQYLPPRAMQRVLQFLLPDVRAMGYVSRICREWRSLALDDAQTVQRVWRNAIEHARITDDAAEHMPLSLLGVARALALDPSCSDHALQLVGARLAEAPGPPQLRELSLATCTAVTDRGIKLFGKCAAGQALTKLSLRGCKQLSDAALAHVAKYMPALTHLDLAECVLIGDTGLRAVGLVCTALTDVRLAGCYNVSDVGLMELCAAAAALQRLDVRRCIGISDEGIAAVLTTCDELTELELAGLPQLTDDSLAALTQLGRKLVRLDVSACPSVTDRGLAKLGAKCPRLQRVVATRSPSVTERAVQSFAANVLQLVADK